MTKRIGIVGGSEAYSRPFMEHGGIYTVHSAADVEDLMPDVLVFTGGEDVDPYLYDEPPHPRTFYNTRRDQREMDVFAAGLEVGCKFAGICRGSQFLTVMAGGKLVQDIYNHGIMGTHPLYDAVGDPLDVEITSTHHQMMYPYDLDDGSFKVIATAVSHGMEGLPKGAEEPDHVVEAVWYPVINALGVQGHPEYMAKDSTGWQWYQSLLREFIFN